MTTIILRIPAAKTQSGYSRSTIYLRIAQGLWTKPVSLGPRAVGWPSNEIDALNAARISGKNDAQIRELVETLHTKRKELMARLGCSHEKRSTYPRLLAGPVRALCRCHLLGCCIERVCMNDLTENLATPDNSRNCEEPPKLPLAFTVITGIKPARLTKIIGLNAKGGMRKETSAMLSQGQAQRVEVADLNGLKSHLDTLTSAQAVTWGVTKDDTVAVGTQGDTEAQQASAIARTRENFKFRAAPGVMMLDHDGLPDGELSPLQFRDRLIAAAPALADAPMLWRPSASAGCVAPDGSILSGLTRHRLYILCGGRHADSRGRQSLGGPAVGHAGRWLVRHWRRRSTPATLPGRCVGMAARAARLCRAIGPGGRGYPRRG